jgi:hypothetical protein
MSVARVEVFPESFPRVEQFRFVSLTQPDGKLSIPIQAFFRRIGLPRVFDEMVAPGLEEGCGMVVMAMRDRPWPPWGIGAQSVSALTFIYPIGEERAGLSNVFALPEEELSIGLLAALYREAMSLLAERATKRVHFVTRQESQLAAHVLAGAGFKETGIPFITDEARYTFHEAELSSHLAALGIVDSTPLQLLGDEFAEAVLERIALYLLTLNASFGGYWKESVKAPEIIPNTSLVRISAQSPPGGPPPPGSRGPIVRTPVIRPPTPAPPRIK